LLVINGVVQMGALWTPSKAIFVNIGSHSAAKLAQGTGHEERAAIAAVFSKVDLFPEGITG